MIIKPYAANLHKDAEAFIFESERPPTMGLKDRAAVVWFWNHQVSKNNGISMTPEGYIGQAVYFQKEEAIEFANFILEHVK